MSPPTPQDILELTHGLQQDIQTALAKLVTIRSWLAAQPDLQRQLDHACPHAHCQIAFATEARLAAHRRNVHGKPI